MAWNMHYLVGNIIRGVLNSIANQVRPEDYELSICLTDKNNIVIHQEVKTLEGYRQKDVDWIINEIKNFANEDEKGECHEVQEWHRPDNGL